MCHGALPGFPSGNSYLTYLDYLGKCLAANNFVAVSIRHLSDGFEAARISFIAHLKYLLGSTDPAEAPTKYQLKGKPLVLLGQSEGGHGAALAASDINALALGDLATSVKVLIGLAAVPGVADASAFASAESLLLLQGTHDGDPVAKGAVTLEAYDGADLAFARYFCWIHGANHINFLAPKSISTDVVVFGNDNPTQIQRDTQWLITKNYVVGFLRWKIKGETVFRPAFIGDGTFNFPQSQDVVVQGDLQKDRVHIVPRYDQLFSQTMCSAADISFVSFKQAGVAVPNGSSATYKSLTAHGNPLFNPDTTLGFRVQWNRIVSPNPMVTIPCIRKFKLTDRFLEFHAILAVSTFDLILPTYLEYKAGGIGSVKKSATVLVTIVPPLLMKTKIISGNPTRATLGTIRIPLSAYSIAGDIVNATALKLDFQNAPLSSGDIAFTTFRVRGEPA